MMTVPVCLSRVCFLKVSERYHQIATDQVFGDSRVMIQPYEDTGITILLDIWDRFVVIAKTKQTATPRSCFRLRIERCIGRLDAE